MVVEVAKRQVENQMGLRNLTLVVAPNLFVPTAAEAVQAPKRTFFHARAQPEVASDPLKELLCMESTSTALHALATASMR